MDKTDGEISAWLWPLRVLSLVWPISETLLSDHKSKEEKERKWDFSTSQHDCNIDDDETNSSNDQGICNDAEIPTPNNIRKSKQKRA